MRLVTSLCVKHAFHHRPLFTTGNYESNENLGLNLSNSFTQVSIAFTYCWFIFASSQMTGSPELIVRLFFFAATLLLLGNLSYFIARHPFTSYTSMDTFLQYINYLKFRNWILDSCTLSNINNRSHPKVKLLPIQCIYVPMHNKCTDFTHPN